MPSPSLFAAQNRPSFEKILTHIFYVYMDDFLFSVNTRVDESGNQELLVHYDREMVLGIISAAVEHNIYSRARTSKDPDDPFNLTQFLMNMLFMKGNLEDG